LNCALKPCSFKAKRQAMEVSELNTHIADILITLGTQIHLIRPLEKNATMFLYVALDRKEANLGMARIQPKTIEGKLEI
jgi:hypothetical protein